jgi:DNA invertase Pin-like site-specific DNA recombinase
VTHQGADREPQSAHQRRGCALRSHLRSLGISLRSATEPIDDTSTGKLMEGVPAAFAQFDNDVRSDRTRAGMRAALESDDGSSSRTAGPAAAA